MSKTKKRIYGVILLIAGLGLLLDRLSSTSPATAQAFTSRPLTDLGVTPVEAPTVSVAAAPFPITSDDPADRDQYRDPFATTTAVRKLIQGSDGAHPGAHGAQDRTVRAERPFDETHQLNGVMTSDRESIAVVDDLWVRVGDRLGPCELIATSGTSVTFRCPKGDVELWVEGAKPPNKTDP